MIEFRTIDTSDPYIKFKEIYDNAVLKNQKNIEAIVISSFNSIQNEVESRFVNLKYIHKNDWIFFSNYNSPKANNFKENKQISALFYWNTVNVQIRMKAHIRKTSSEVSDEHFLNRDFKKNALAIISEQSQKISSYEEVLKRYQSIITKKNDLSKRPKFWGGFSFTPYYFEFWEGNENRINKREVFEFKNEEWLDYIIQP
tara:strand:- start:204 stop:803 length:600 start_codon:yes stop_codon:yes gene_type:complete